jgi:DNA-binding protein H-NS
MQTHMSMRSHEWAQAERTLRNIQMDKNNHINHMIKEGGADEKGMVTAAAQHAAAKNARQAAAPNLRHDAFKRTTT